MNKTDARVFQATCILKAYFGNNLTLRHIEEYPYGDITPSEASASFQSLVESGHIRITNRMQIEITEGTE